MLDFERFDIKLDTDVIGRNFLYYEEVDSTNSKLLNEKDKELLTGTVLFAEKQNAGKGRRNRVWNSLKDQNLTFSILLTDAETLQSKLSLINLTASLAVAVSLENLYQLKCELKWPNDVLVKGKKISGILIESSIRSDKIERVVIGIGVNINQNSFQGEYNIPPTSVKMEINDSVEREKIFAELLNNFELYLNTLLESPKNILSEWRNKCRMIGDKITIITDSETKTGIFDDIDDDGFMILKQKGNYEKIHFGDVSIA